MAKPTSKKRASSRPSLPKVPCFALSAVRGIQAKGEYYCAMVPLRYLKDNFFHETEEMPAQMRAQRMPNKRRFKQVSEYVVNNPSTYCFSSITVTIRIEGDDIDAFKFEPVMDDCDAGLLNIPLGAKFVVADGQHRVGGLRQALKENPELGDESISVVMFLEIGLKRSQQMFHDLNHYAAKPTKSLNLLYDHRDKPAAVTRQVMAGFDLFRSFTDTEKTSLGKKSGKLFTFNGLHEATEILLDSLPESNKESYKLLVQFWMEVSTYMKDWGAVYRRTVAPGEIRQESLAGHAITLVALARVGAELLQHDDWKQRLKALNLQEMDWGKANPALEDLVIFGGRIHKSKGTTIALAAHLMDSHS